jgi:hypothetical protein
VHAMIEPLAGTPLRYAEIPKMPLQNSCATRTWAV